MNRLLQSCRLASLRSAVLAALCAAAALAHAAPRPTKIFHSEGNPVLGDGTYFSADAAPLSADGRLYIYTGHDVPTEEVGGFVMYDYGVFVTPDPASGDWDLYAHNLDPDNVFDWATGNRAYAGHAVRGLDGRYYWYVPVEWKNSEVPNPMAIGVAVSDGPLGPWKDPIGKPLVSWVDVFGEQNSGQEVIDPHLFINDDGTIYLYWGSWGVTRVVKLKDTMSEMDGEIITMTGLDAFFEAPWVFKRNGLYYLVYDWKRGGSKWTPSNYQAAIGYATSSSPTGPWKFEGIILSGTSSTTVHPSVIEHDGRWWITYHTKDGKTGGHFRRTVAIDEVHWDGDRMLPVEQTWANPSALQLTSNLTMEAELTASYSEEPPMRLAALKDGRPPVARLPPDMWSTYRGTDSEVESDWAQYTWDVPVPITGVGIQFHQDPNWHRPPADWVLEYQDEKGTWHEVKDADYPTQPDRWLTVNFTPVVTKALRATFKGLPEGDFFHSMIVSEWEVYAEQATELPSGRITTTLGEAPELPETIRLNFETSGTIPVPVHWPSIIPERYAESGTFTIQGKAAGQAEGYVTLEIVVTR